MTHDELLILVSSVHVGICTLSVIALFQCGSWSTRFRTWLKDVDNKLDRLRRDIAFELAEKLKPVFEKAEDIFSVILSPEGGYCEGAVNPAGSEEYRNAISGYVEKSMHKFADWRSLHIIRSSNLFWAIYLSWGITLVFIIELLLLAIMFAIEKGFEYPLSNKLLWGFFIVTGIFVVNALIGLVFSLVYHNKGIKCKS